MEDGTGPREVVKTGSRVAPGEQEKREAALRGETASGSHLGLANIAGRLRLIYGGRADIGVFGGEGGRTVVRIDIPRTD